MSTLDNQVALVTGGGRGIGRGIVLELAKEGADIAIGDIDLANAETTAAEVRDLGRQCSIVELDVTNEDQAEAAIAEVVAERGRLDALVNNAGVVGQNVGGGSIELSDWDACYEVNLKGIWIMSRAVVDQFRGAGGGKIVNIASIAGRRGGAGLAHYNASKAGAISVTQSLASDLGALNINVNAVCPGLLWTDMWRQLEAMIGGDPADEVVDRRKFFESYLETNCPLQREQTPEDIGMAVAFLASDRARNITGQALNVDGGIQMN